MRFGVALATAYAVLATPAVAAPASSVGAEPLFVRLPAVASSFCIDFLSGNVTLPASPESAPKLFARYGLTFGIPNEGMKALGGDIGLVAQATLASGNAIDGAFIVALGGRAGPSCRIIVYQAPLDGLFVKATYAGLQTPQHGWRSLPPGAQPQGVMKLSLLKRDAERRPYLANLLAPATVGPIAIVATIAAIPPQVTIPEGY
jgi:hypothetical protein